MRLPVLGFLLAASTVLAACGAGPARDEPIPSGTLDVVVREPVNRSQTAVRYLRVEDDRGKPVLEREFRTAPVELSAPLAAARYRVITWDRECTGPCGNATDATLGKAMRICGTRVTVADGVVAKVAVEAPADVDCSMTVP